ncbi:MAG: M48 family metallopeptidase [Gloeomargaritaceae cyanobacterium C42_A2020_066]|nr:M48 family metallopeptidase [Gloeomargaritaceae cyanobacterium C42_A2020_066]
MDLPLAYPCREAVAGHPPRRVWRGLTAGHFRHPLDQEATAALRGLGGVDLLVRGLLSAVAEEVLYLDNLGTAVRLGPDQLPELYALHLDAARILDIEPPQLYLRQHPVPNAYTLAVRGKQPFIVLHTSLVDLLTPAEVQAVIGHELGHLKCEHGVYLTLANLLVLAAGRLGAWGAVLAQSLQWQLLHWLRCAELSCDRAALLVAQDVTVVVSVLMKLTGGSATLATQLNPQAFLAQARDYRAAGRSTWTDWLQQGQSLGLTHPLPVLRAAEIDAWAAGPAYRNLIRRTWV